jgi:predicted ABC-type transport system involved in lysophospholipase L1 biosynthesis ATPase subunit
VKNRGKDYVLGNRIELLPIPESITGAHQVRIAIADAVTHRPRT